jgi:hypothetical protein
MKKNRTLRIASVMLVLALITTCIISGTFAKYVTTGQAKDIARVAKWGVTITAETGKAFGTAYTRGSSAISASASVDTDSVFADDKVVAPGTEGTLLSVSIAESGREVECEVKYTVTKFNLTGWGDYCPLVFKVGNEEIKQGTGTVAELETAVKNAITGLNATYKVGETIADSSTTIAWEWPFHTTDENDSKDTALGSASIPATIEIQVDVEIAQVD